MRLSELAEALALPLEGDPGLEIAGLASLEDARPTDLCFVSGPRYRTAFERSKGGAFLAPPDFDTGGRHCLRSLQPYADFARAIDLLTPPRAVPQVGVHPTAVVAADAVLKEDVSVGACVVIGPRSCVGARSVIHPHVTLYADVQIGEDCVLHAGACLRDGVRLGNRVIVQNGAVLGSDGFGFAFRADGTRVRVPHRCGVEVGDDSEVGANTTIDASHAGHPHYGHAEARTRIGKAVKIDNQVHVAHGCSVGDECTLCGQAALAGSTEIEKHVFLGARAGSGGHLRVGEGSMIGGATAVTGDVPPGSALLGTPAMERKLFGRVFAAWKRLPELITRVRRIERKLGLREED